MYCENCGYKLREGDKYCENCGAKIENVQIITHEVEKSNVENQIKEDKKIKVKKNKSKTIIVIIIGILVIALGVFVLLESQPKDVNLKTEELALLIQNKEEAKYAGDNMHVKGYVLVDLEHYNESQLDNDYFVLVPAMDEKSMELMVQCKNLEVLPKDLGTGSEVILHGKLEINNENFTTLLNVESVEIIKKIEPIEIIESVEKMLENSNKYLNKNVSVIGQLTVTNMSGAYISDDLFGKAVWLYGISNQELADIYMNGGWCVTTGKLTLDGTNFALEVEKIELYKGNENNITNQVNITDYEIYSIDDISGYPLSYIDSYVALKGWQPTDLATDKNRNYVDVLWNDSRDFYVIIEGNKTATELATGEIAYYGFLILRDEELVLVTE